MKLIVITTPTFFTEEDQIITALFEEGLDYLHLRKPGTEPITSNIRVQESDLELLRGLQNLGK